MQCPRYCRRHWGYMKPQRNSPYLQSIQSNDNNDNITVSTRCYGLYSASIIPSFFLLEPPCGPEPSLLQTHEPDWPKGPLPLIVLGMGL